jgi:redox-sensitive bicupin YhaK (pirin superfamily)
MITRRPADERGKTNIDWLNSWHTFSFGGYRDDAHERFGPLRVINDDRVAPGAGFDTHPHRDMEIITVVNEGALEHRDSTGGGGVLRPGGVQVMSAGSGLTHSEFNHSADEPVHFHQIWIIPNQRGATPRYEDRQFDVDGRLNRWQTVASPDGRDGSIAIHQDAVMALATVEPGQTVRWPFETGRIGWLQVMAGAGELNGTALGESDGAAVREERELIFTANQSSELMLFDMTGV